MNKKITEEQKQRAIRLYKGGKFTLVEISNLVGFSLPSLENILRQCFKDGTVTPKSSWALKPNTPAGQGKGPYVKKGRKAWNIRFTAEDLEKIAEEYYSGNEPVVEFMARHKIYSAQMQRMRKLWGWKYPERQKGRRRKVATENE